jgi:hypothetical protein
MHWLYHIVDEVVQQQFGIQQLSYRAPLWLHHVTWKLHCCTIYHTFNNADAIGWALGTSIARPLG